MGAAGRPHFGHDGRWITFRNNPQFSAFGDLVARLRNIIEVVMVVRNRNRGPNPDGHGGGWAKYTVRHAHSLCSLAIT